MRKNDINDLKTKTVDELRKILSDSRSEILKLNHELSMKKSPNTNKAKNLKKDVARVLTFLSMKEKMEKPREAGSSSAGEKGVI